MSKKKETQRFKEGMEAGARPFEEKFEQQAAQLENLERDMRDGISSLGNIQDELIDISEEHEDRIESIDKKVQLGLDERDGLGVLSESEKEILGGMILKLSQDYSFNIDQKEFVSNVLRSLGLSHPQIVEINIIENVESIKIQKIIFRVLSELLFLEKNSFENAIELSEWFALNRKSKDSIFNEISMMSNAIGHSGIIKKYCVTETEMKKRKKYPKLEVNTKISKFDPMTISFVTNLNMSNDFDVETETYKTESACRNAIGDVIYKYYKEQQRYISFDGDKFVGKEIINHYYNELKFIVDRIVDFVKVQNIKIDVKFLEDLMSTLEEEILAEIKKELSSGNIVYSVTDWSDYVDMIQVEIVDDFVETIFGGFKEVKRYQESLDSQINIVTVADKMGEEVCRIVDVLQGLTYAFISKYVYRIDDLIQQINIKTGNE